MHKIYVHLICISSFVIMMHSSLCNGAIKIITADMMNKDRKERDPIFVDNRLTGHVERYKFNYKEGPRALKILEQKVRNTYCKHTRYDALKEALEVHDEGAITLYAPGLNLWPMYIQEIQKGDVANVTTLLSLMDTAATKPSITFNDYCTHLKAKASGPKGR